MKKTIAITIAGILFYIEEDAYQHLYAYLESVKAHFASFAEHEEIIADIESRIAEQFLEHKQGSKENIVIEAEVKKLITTMGNVEDFGDVEQSSDPSSAASSYNQKTRRLFKNPDDVVIAGVSSGLAAYYGVDAVVVRIIFVTITLFGGGGVLLYLILWLVIPEAKTATEKLQMRGEAITLESVNEMVKDKVQEFKKNSEPSREAATKTFSKIVRFPFLVIAGIIRFVVLKLFPLIGRIIGVVLTALGVFGMFWITFVLAMIVFNINSPYVDFPLAQIAKGTLFYSGVVAGYFSFIIPALFLLLLGISLAKMKSVFKTSVSLTLVGVWFLALIAAGVIGFKLAPQIQEYVENSPEFRTIIREIQVKDFTKIEARNDVNVVITQGKEFRVELSGRQKNVDQVSIEVKEGVLTVEKNNKSEICIFCSYGGVTINVTMPKLNEITASNSSRVTAETPIVTDALAINLSNSSHAEFGINASSVVVSISNSSFLDLEGKAVQGTFSAHNSSRIDAGSLILQTATVTANNSTRVILNVMSKLKVTAYNSSSVRYYGLPTLETNAYNSSSVKPIQQATTTPDSFYEPEEMYVN